MLTLTGSATGVSKKIPLVVVPAIRSTKTCVGKNMIIFRKDLSEVSSIFLIWPRSPSHGGRRRSRP